MEDICCVKCKDRMLYKGEWIVRWMSLEFTDWEEDIKESTEGR